MNNLIEQKTIDKSTIRKKILDFEEAFDKHPDSVKGEELDKLCPLKHTFVDGAYVREIFMPKGVTITSKIHKICHPYFIMEGECSVLTDEGVIRLKAPYHGITQPGTKRVIYIHKDTTWVTVHTNPDNGEDLKVIEDRIIAKNFDELPTPEEIKKLKEA